MDSILDLLRRDPEKCVAELEAFLNVNPDSIEALQLAAEVHFELGNAELAWQFLQQALKKDPTGELGGYTKFFWLGQLQGGREGLKWYEKAVGGAQTPEEVIRGLLGMIEIWMTDLCMEPEAEAECESLISRALLTDEQSAESWSILGSIRISQQKEQEARDALLKAAELYHEGLSAGTVHADAIPALVRLTQSIYEMEMFDEVLDLSAEIARLDDQVPDAYYLNCLAHCSLVPLVSDEKERSRHIVGAHDACELLTALPDLDPEMGQAASEMVAALPEPTVEVEESDEEE